MIKSRILLALNILLVLCLAGEVLLIIYNNTSRSVSRSITQPQSHTTDNGFAKQVPSSDPDKGGYDGEVADGITDIPEQYRMAPQPTKERLLYINNRHIVKNSDEYKRLREIEREMVIRTRYSILLNNLNLDANKANDLVGLLIQRDALGDDINAATQNLEPQDGILAAREMRKQFELETFEKIESLIGEKGVADLKNFESNMAANMMLLEIQQSLNAKSLPGLTSAQQANFIALIEANEKEAVMECPPAVKAHTGGKIRTNGPNIVLGESSFLTLSGGRSYLSPEGLAMANIRVPDEAIELATASLSKEQLEIFRQVVSQQESARELASYLLY